MEADVPNLNVLAHHMLEETEKNVNILREAPGSTETSVLTRATRRNIPEDTILHILRDFAKWTGIRI
jgi:hypothetical protein